MTEKAIEELTSRLVQVWHIKEYMRREAYSPRFCLEGTLEEGLTLIYRYYVGGVIRLSLVQTYKEEVVGRLDWNSTQPQLIEGALVASDSQNEFFQPLAQGGLPFFRRGCWLCGGDITANGEEKAKWIQGISREQIKAWNLRLNEQIEGELARVAVAFGVVRWEKVTKAV